MTVELFIPCFIDQFYPQTAFHTVQILKKAGCEVLYDEKQTCCGQPAFNAGFWDEAKTVGRKFLNDFSGDNPIVSPSASCTGMVKTYYDDLFTNTFFHNKCRSVQKNIHELSSFLVHVLNKKHFGSEFAGRAVYHDSCSALRECKIRSEPRALLAEVRGLELVEMNHSDSCCGFGGTFSVKFGSISSAMAQQKINAALEMEAAYIISTDASCLLQLQAYIDKHDIPMKTMHLVDILAYGWCS